MSHDTFDRTRYGPFGDELSPLPKPADFDDPTYHLIKDLDLPCAVCQRQGCEVVCIHCSGDSIRPGRIATHVLYCSDRCRALHQPEHAEACARRKALARACNLFFEIWHIYQQETYNLSHVTLVSEDEDGYINLELDESVPDARGWRGDTYDVLFPEDLTVPNDTSWVALQAVLYDHQSIDV